MPAAMEAFKERKVWTPVPEFGGWDRNAGSPDYSVVFSNARANRKQRKTELDRSSFTVSVGDNDLIPPLRHQAFLPPPPPPPPTRRRRHFLSYFRCCVMV